MRSTSRSTPVIPRATLCGWVFDHSRAPLVAAPLRCIAELHSARRWESLVRGTDPTFCRLQIGDLLAGRQVRQIKNLRYAKQIAVP